MRRFPHRAGLFFALAFSFVGPGCSAAKKPGETPREVEPSPIVVPHVRKIETEGQPTLHLILREGDPTGAVAFALHADDSRVTLALFALLEERLATYSPRLSAHSLGLVGSLETADSKIASAFLRDLRTVLLEPVRPEAPFIARANHLLEVVSQRPSNEVDRCLGKLGSDAPSTEPFDAAALDEIRRVAAQSGRVGFAALGSTAFLDPLLESKNEPWPEGPGPLDRYAAGAEVSVTVGLGRTVRLAVQTPRATQALSVARALDAPDHPLRTRLTPLTGRFSLTGAEVVLRPSGACLVVTLEQPEGARAPASADWALLAEVTRFELEQALDLTPPEDARTAALLSPARPDAAAALAAWALGQSTFSLGERFVFEFTAPKSDQLRDSELAAALEKARARLAEPRVPVTHRTERGQAESWLLVASPCGVNAETEEEAGFRALTIHALAENFSGRDDVTLEPWVTPAAIGLLGHAPLGRGETPRHLALRVARAVAAAIAGDELDGRAVATARAKLVEQVGDDPGRGLALTVVSDAHPSLLDPRGLADALGRASTADLERVRRELSAEPLRAAFLDSSPQGELEPVRSALSGWLAHPGAEAACVERSLTPANPGLWTLTTISEEIEPSSHISIPSTLPLSVGRAFAHLLNRRAGPLSRALSVPGWAATAQVTYLGGPRAGAFVFELRAEPEGLLLAEAQLRAALHELSQSNVALADVQAAEQERRLREDEARKSPRGRIVELWLGQPSIPLDQRALDAAQKSLVAGQHRVIRVLRRK